MGWLVVLTFQKPLEMPKRCDSCWRASEGDNSVSSSFGGHDGVGGE